MRLFFNQFIQPLLNSDCPLCLATVSSSQLICRQCHTRLPRLQSACGVCAMPIAHNQATCGKCLESSPAFFSTVAAFHYEPPVSHFITALKYHHQIQSLQLLCDELADSIKLRYARQPLPSVMIPVPLHNKRLRSRGFNQAVLVATQLANKLKLPLTKQLLIRRVDTSPQAALDAQKRQQNLAKAFAVKIAPPAHCVLIDDVMTTGATVNEAAKTLLKAGAKRVDVWCVARAFPVD